MAVEKTQQANKKKSKQDTKSPTGKVRAPHDTSPVKARKGRGRVPANPPKPAFSPMARPALPAYEMESEQINTTIQS